MMPRGMGTRGKEGEGDFGVVVGTHPPERGSRSAVADTFRERDGAWDAVPRNVTCAFIPGWVRGLQPHNRDSEVEEAVFVFFPLLFS